MEIEDLGHLPNDESVIFGHKVCQTRNAKWLCISDIYQKFHRPNFYDIGGTYIEDIADYWFMYKTEQISNIFLLHIFVYDRQENKFGLAISRNAENMKIDNKNAAVYLTQSLVEHRFKRSKEISQNYVITFSFSSYDIDLVKDRSLYIFISFDSLEHKGSCQGFIDQVKINHDFKALLFDPIGSDFTIESADGVKFQVHRVILAGYSDVFKAMLKEETAESQNSYVKLVDVGNEDLQCILECIYTGTISNLENCNCINMLMLADRYNLKGLRELSQYALSERMSVENALEILIVADSYNSETLKTAALKFIKKNTMCIQTSTFKEINNPELLRHLCEYIIPS
ncbi:unnamed protein product [Diatraea saccharalis]|uniref:BTB domain-containing protein n=1 Tax=Diatraea saccharalis TaxID=40085 RepID=A0A9P0C3T4_9NEOP|nr:unnamed protein product [Diatraea saccharalis]